MPKFFTSGKNNKGDILIIESEDAKHIKKVLRLNEGDEITVCDGQGTDYTAKIKEISNNEVICDILEKKLCDTEPEVKVTLYQGLPKAAKMDYIIQKTTELGISRIVPVALSRCVVKIENNSAELKKLERWRKIAYEAAKQSGRGIVPVVGDVMNIDEVISVLKEYDLVFVPYECEQEVHLKEVLKTKPEAKNVAFIIGPEGGFDITETQKLKEAGVPTITLGKRILRTETAGEAVLSMVMYEFDQI